MRVVVANDHGAVDLAKRVLKHLEERGIEYTYLGTAEEKSVDYPDKAREAVEEYRKAAVDAVQKLSVDVGIPTKLEALKEEDLDFLAESAHADACAPGNPKDASVEDLKALFRKLM